MPSRRWTLAEQAFHLRRDFPDGRVIKLTPTVLMWTGRLTPTPLSREYTVRIRYAAGHYPQVLLVEPSLEPEERKHLHHLYPGGELCLHKPDEWDPTMLLADTILPWTAEWLAHYELWKRTHQWYGDGDAADDKSTTVGAPAPQPPQSRAERRRSARAETRRAVSASDW